MSAQPARVLQRFIGAASRSAQKVTPAFEKKRMSMLWVSEGPLATAILSAIEREAITVQNLAPYEEADVDLRVMGSKTHEPDPSQLTETRVDLEYPVGTGDSPADVASLVRQVLENLGKKYGVKVEPCAFSYHPRPRPMLAR